MVTLKSEIHPAKRLNEADNTGKSFTPVAPQAEPTDAHSLDDSGSNVNQQQLKFAICKQLKCPAKYTALEGVLH
jgi:hypothetical protein